MDVTQSEAGRETDTRVAEWVLGERRPPPVPEDAQGLVWDSRLSGGGNWQLLSIGSEGDIPVWCPLPFSTDVGSAFRAIEPFLPHFRLECSEESDYVEFDPSQQWHCDIWTSVGVACVSAATKELAMCRAALLAREMLDNPAKYLASESAES